MVLPFLHLEGRWVWGEGIIVSSQFWIMWPLREKENMKQSTFRTNRLENLTQKCIASFCGWHLPKVFKSYFIFVYHLLKKPHSISTLKKKKKKLPSSNKKTPPHNKSVAFRLFALSSGITWGRVVVVQGQSPKFLESEFSVQNFGKGLYFLCHN